MVVKFAWEKTINDLAKEFTNGDWNAVTKWNIFVFNHRCKFLTHKRKEEAEAARIAAKKARAKK